MTRPANAGSLITVAATNGAGPDLAPLASGGFVDLWNFADNNDFESGEVFDAGGNADMAGGV
jgi:hypothetical protein